MNISTNSFIIYFAKVFAQWFAVGRLPAPGTMGSIACLPPLWIMQQHFGLLSLWVFAAVISIFGWLVVTVYQRAHHSHDASEIVIDEVAGMSLCLCFLPMDMSAWLLGFVMFRLCDILKPFPIHVIDRHMRSSFGVMFDDLLAGIYAAGLSGILWYFFH